MINGDREETVSIWAKYAPIDTSVVHHPTPVPEIFAAGTVLFKNIFEPTVC